MVSSIRNFARLFLVTLFLSRNGILAQTSADDTDLESDTESARLAEASSSSAKAVAAEDKEVTTLVGTRTVPIDQGVPTGSYTTYTSKITLRPESSGNATEPTVTFTGSVSTTIAGNGTETATADEPKNTQPCNNYVEFCSRKYSNITEIGCHNSPFVRKGSSAANQQLEVTAQLNDGVRFLQAQIHWPTDGNEPHFCHGSCDILDAGPITEWLTTVREWVDAHPYDVITILFGNGNYSQPNLYAPWIESTGILKYAYLPPFLPMALDDWPTLEQMIISGKRVVMFLDYEANQQEYPWLLDQFSQMWETPFDPEDRSFPCTVQRPPNLPEADAKNRIYLFNHNLNAKFDLFGAEILVPAVPLVNQTNAVSGPGSLGNSTAGCVANWGRPPNILNVDYYNFGNYEGSVFEVAARFNNVTYNRQCCGKVPDAAAGLRPVLLTLVLAFAASILLA